MSQNIENIYNKTKSYLSDIFKPVIVFFNPALTKWKNLTYPLKQSWEKYASKNPRESAFFKWSFFVFGGMFFSGVFLILLVYLGTFGKLPTYDELRIIENANASEIYSSDNVLLGKYYTENRTTIKLDSISPYLITALLAIEDKRFFTHSGIDLRSWLRVFKGLATNQQNLGGGSTLSQQLAKNLFPRKKYSISSLGILINKIRENITSIKLENIYNKEELLTLYLNTVPFGGNRFGVQEASRYFYNKKPLELTPDQAATLIGMLKATTALDPTRNPDNSKKRRDLVLNQMLKNKDFRFESQEMSTISAMVTNGAITQPEFDILINKPINAKIHEDIGNNDGIATYFREYLRTRELPKILKNITKEDGSSYNIYTDGLKISTTLDSRLQKHGEDAVNKHLSYLQNQFYLHWKGYKTEKPWGDDKWINDQVKKSDRYSSLKENGLSDSEIDSIFNIPVSMSLMTWDKIPVERDTMLTPLDSVRYYFTMLNCGFMAMDFKTGYIKTWVGGTNFKFFQYDHILSKRQAGSTFKPIVYAAALIDSISPCAFIRNDKVTIKDWTPRNSDEKYGGWYSVVGGLTYSVNVIVAQLIEKVGIQKILDLAKKMGVTSEMPREYGISLGAADISLLDMMKVYGTIANKGVRPEPICILKIEDRYGKVIYDYEEELIKNPEIGPHEKALEPEIASVLSRMLQTVINSGTGNNLRSQYVQHGEFAGKTGTTQNHADGWFIAYNPQLVTGAWVGGPSPAVRFKSMNLGSGAAMALPIVGNFWYNLSIDNKHAKIASAKFEIDEVAASKTACPFRIGIHPDTLNILLQDSTLRDSILNNGYRNLREIVEKKFGIESSDEPDGGGESGGQNTDAIIIEPKKPKDKNNKDN